MAIQVPKTPKRAFNKNRRPSELLLRQIDHLEWAVRPASMRKPKQLRKKKVKTESEAAERIAYLTEMLLESQHLTPSKPPPARTRRPRRKAKKPKTRARVAKRRRSRQ